MTIWVAVSAALAYLLGSIPFGLLLTRLAGLGDIRHIGSGNIGATNVLRTGNKALAALTLVFDVAKGVAATAIGAMWGEAAMLAAAVAVVVGHMFPVWLGFRGGKGVATALGVVAALAWPVALVAAAVWLAVAILSRYSSAASLAAALSAAFYAGLALDRQRALVVTAIAVLIIIRHRENIRRLVAGTESRISLSKG